MAEDAMAKVMKSRRLREIVNWIESEERIDMTDKNEMNALMYCAKYGLREPFKLLMDRGANMFHQNRAGDTALHLATQLGQKQIVEAVMECNTATKEKLIHMTNDHGNTALHYACFWRFADIAEILADNGANAGSLNRYQKTPLDFSGHQLGSFLQLKQVRIEDKRTNSHDVDAIQQRTEIKAKHTMEYNKAVLMNLDPLSITLNEPLWTSNTSQMYMGKIKEHSALIRKLSQVSSSDATHRLKEAVISFENINHDNLMLISGVCYEPELVCIAYKCSSDIITLHQLLHDPEVTITPHAILQQMISICRAITYLHSKNIFHSAIQSRNIMLDGRGQVRVGMYGLGSTCLSEFDQATFKVTEPAYLPPEVLSSGKILNGEACDIYSFGMLLWEMSTRQVPYGAMSPMHIGLKILTENMRPEMPEYIPNPLAQLINLCWSDDAVQRPQFRDIQAVIERLPSAI